jgi:hypothetical protein
MKLKYNFLKTKNQRIHEEIFEQEDEIQFLKSQIYEMKTKIDQQNKKLMEKNRVIIDLEDELLIWRGKCKIKQILRK